MNGTSPLLAGTLPLLNGAIAGLAESIDTGRRGHRTPPGGGHEGNQGCLEAGPGFDEAGITHMPNIE